ncbi:MAG: DUF2989 domain-containing protein [Colwellia sp.]
MKLIFVLILPFILLGCNQSATLAELCEQNTEICTEFGEDNWCKAERIKVALTRIQLKQTQKDLEKYNLLLAYENYIDCMGLAKQIQHIKLKEKTTLRTNNYLKAKNKMAILSEQTLTSEHPHLLYYHWSRESNKKALQKFLQLEGSPLVENSTAQFHLATYYTKRDTKKTLSLLFHALELHQQGTEINAEIFSSLTSIYTYKKKYKQAYIWLKVSQLVKNESNQKNEKTLAQYQEAYHLDSDFLDDVAINTLEKIKNATFKAPKY